MNQTMKNNIEIAESYYKNIFAKNFDEIEKCLHEDIQFISPCININNKQELIESTKKFSEIVGDIQIKEKCDSGNTVILIYYFELTKPVIQFRSAVLMKLKDNLISNIELFYDRGIEVK